MSAPSGRSPKRVMIRKPVSRSTTLLLGIAIWIIFFTAWELAVIFEGVNPLLVPPPEKVLTTLIGLGIIMGTFAAAESFFNPFVSAWRYLPAPAFIPILLMWLGTGEGPKLALLFIGVVFFLITLVMDYTRQVRIELIETSLTLGASEKQVLWTVIVPAVMPNVVVAMRQMLAVSWTYLVIAEIVASTTGIGAMMMRARRFLHTDEIMAGILVIGILGLLFDVLFRWLHRWFFGYLYNNAR